MSKVDNISSSVRFSNRSRTPVTLYNPTISTISSLNEKSNFLALGKGNGIKLSENEQFNNSLNKYTSQDDIIINLHRLLYGIAGKNTLRKKNIRQFQGYVLHPTNTGSNGTNGSNGSNESNESTITKEKIIRRLNDRKWTILYLKELCEMFGIEKTGDKTIIIERLVMYLIKPYQGKHHPTSSNSNTSNITISSKEKNKNTTATAKTKTNKRKLNIKEKDKDKQKQKQKRPLTAFFIFSQELRSKIKKEHPEFGVTDIARELGVQWRTLSNAKKQPYFDRAAKLKESSEKENNSSKDEPVNKKRKSKSPEKKCVLKRIMMKKNH